MYVKEDSPVAEADIDQVMSCLTVMASEKKWVCVNPFYAVAQNVIYCWPYYSSVVFAGVISFLKEFEKHFSLTVCMDKLKQQLPALYPI